MINTITLLVLTQAIGACIGVGFAIWGEISYINASRDNEIDYAERVHLHAVAYGLKIGMVLVLLSSLGLVILSFVNYTQLQPALTTSYWILIVLALLLIYTSWSLSRKKISFSLGSAAIFTAWWFIVYLTFGFFKNVSFGSALALYVIAVGIFYVLLWYIRFFIKSRNEHIVV